MKFHSPCIFKKVQMFDFLLFFPEHLRYDRRQEVICENETTEMFNRFFFRRAGICCAALLLLQAILLSGCSDPSAWADLLPEESGDWQQSRETVAALPEFSGSDDICGYTSSTWGRAIPS